MTLTLGDLARQVAERQGKLADLDQQAGKLTAKVDSLQAQLAELEQERLDLKRARVGANGPVKASG